MLIIGLMSGTSMDGIDVALLETNGEHLIIEHEHMNIPYPADMTILLKSAERAMREAAGCHAHATHHYQHALQTYLAEELQHESTQLKLDIKRLTHYITTTLRRRQKNTAQLCFSDIIQLSTQLHADAVKQLLILSNYEPAHIDVNGYHGQTLFQQPHQ